MVTLPHNPNCGEDVGEWGNVLRCRGTVGGDVGKCVGVWESGEGMWGED